MPRLSIYAIALLFVKRVDHYVFRIFLFASFACVFLFFFFY